MAETGKVPAADFTRIDGIGAATAAQLRELGYRTFRQLAEASGADLEAASDDSRRISAARILKEGWLEQAALLAEKEEPLDLGAEISTEAIESDGSDRRTFTVRVRIDPESGTVLASQVVDVDSAVEADSEVSAQWNGWNPGEVVEFISGRLAGGEPVAGSEPEPDHESTESNPEPHFLHRFGVVTAGGSWATGSPVRATLVLDPAQLQLPPRRQADVLVNLCAQKPGGARSVLLATQRQRLGSDRPFATSVNVVIPVEAEPAPVMLLAAVRVLVDRAGERPEEGLGTASLQLAPA